MKKFLFFICLLSVGLLNGQDNTKTYNHEIKINGLTTVLGNPEINYEYLINENSGFGLYGNFNVDKNRLWPYNYMAGLHYRLYVGGYYAAGFFFEGGLSAVSQEISTWQTDPNGNGFTVLDDVTGIGPTIAIGGKFAIRKTIIFEFFGGIGRNFSSNEDTPEAFPRIGISVGKRF